MSPTVGVVHQEGWAKIVINRPDALNAIDDSVVAGLHGALDVLAEDSGVRCLVITGAGEQAFAAGADIAALLARGAPEAREGINAGLFQKVEDFPWPVIAAIRGYALGGGCELALACDLRIGGKSAKLGQPEARLGIVPAAGGSHRLTRLVGTGVARDLIYTGRIVAAEEALRLGLLNRVVPDDEVLDTARDTARSILAMAPDAILAAKRLLNAAAAPHHDLASLEIEEQAVLFASDEKRRRMTEFLERRSPSGGAI